LHHLSPPKHDLSARNSLFTALSSATPSIKIIYSSLMMVDHWGIVKADIDVKGGRIYTTGKAGNPDIQPNVTIPIGVATEIIAAEGKIVTAGGIEKRPNGRSVGLMGWTFPFSHQ
jgi:urease alpha subunit